MGWKSDISDYDRRQARREERAAQAQREWAVLYDPVTRSVPRTTRNDHFPPGGNLDLPDFQLMMIPPAADGGKILEILSIFDGLKTNGYRFIAGEDNLYERQTADRVMILSGDSDTARERAELMVTALMKYGARKYGAHSAL